MRLVEIIKSKKSDLGFLQQHADINIFQDPAYARVQNAVNNQEAFCFGAEQDGQIIGILSGVIIQNFGWPVSLFTTRAVIWGGPVVANNDKSITAFLLEESQKRLGKRVIFTQFRNMRDMSLLKPTYERCGYDYIPHLNILIDLQQSQDSLIANINKNKRKNVRKSINKGTVFKQIESEEEFNKAVALIMDTYQRIGIPAPDKSLLDSGFRQLGGSENLIAFGAYWEGEMIGTRLELLYDKLVYDWYAGSNPAYNNKYPNDFLIYHILLWAREQGFQTFDFGGAGKPGVPYGVRDHKSKFGGELVEYGRFDKVHNTYLYNLGKLGLKALQLFK